MHSYMMMPVLVFLFHSSTACGGALMLSEHQIIIRLVVVAVCGSIVGIERERRNWVAGLRTHMLVCVGAALFMIVSIGYERPLRGRAVTASAWGAGN